MDVADKIDALLTDLAVDGQPLGKDERILTALVLYLRSSEIASFWWTHHRQTLLTPWMLSLVEPQENPNDLHMLYLRVVAQVLYKAADDADDSSSFRETVLDPLGKVLIEKFEVLLPEQVDLQTAFDVVVSISAWMSTRISQETKWSENDSLLEKIVRLMVRIDQSTNSSSSKPTDDEDDTPETVGQSDPETAKLLMIRTLTALLDQTCLESCTSLSACIEQFSSVLYRHSEAAQSLPSFYEPLLQWWQQSSNVENRKAYALVLILSTMNLVHVIPSSSFRHIHDGMVKLLLASLASIANDTLRISAWLASALFIEQCGWDLWLTPRETGGQLGRHSNLCALLRLAAGEYKIQMTWFAGVAEKDDWTIEGNDEHVKIVQACAQVLVKGLQYSVEDSEENALPADVIRHVHKSLQQALHTSVQYFGLSESVRKRLSIVTDSVVLLLGSLLMEIDVFSGASGSINEDAFDESEVLHSLSTAMQTENTDKLIPALTVVLASCEGNESLVQLLKDYNIVGSQLENFLECTFRMGISDSSLLSWVCQLVDLWVTVVPGVVPVRSTLLRAIRDCLQTMLQHEDPSPGGLSNVVACYVTLKGDEPPDDCDARLLEQAMTASSIC